MKGSFAYHTCVMAADSGVKEECRDLYYNEWIALLVMID